MILFACNASVTGKCTVAWSAVLIFLFTAAVLPAASSPPLEIKRVFGDFREKESFLRITEFFGAGEDTGKTIVVRSRPEERTGYYFSIRIHQSAPRMERDASLQLQWVPGAGPEVRMQTFPVRLPARRSTLVMIGLTGDDWEDPEWRPLAWKITLLDADGNVVESQQSFLWAQPGDEQG